MKRPHPGDYNQRRPPPNKRILSQSSIINRSSNPLFIIQKSIFLYTLSPLYKQAYNILVQISVAQSRPTYMHQYSINSYSILKAITLGYTSENILLFLNKYMRNQSIPPMLVSFIQNAAMKYIGSARIELKEAEIGNFFYLSLEQNSYVMLKVYDNQDLGKFKDMITDVKTYDDQKTVVCQIELFKENTVARMLYYREVPFHFEFPYKRKVEQHKTRFRNILQHTMHGGRYSLKDLKVELKTFTKLRNYQQAALKSIFFFGQRRLGDQMVKEEIAKSGVIVLPCGAGKTLLGISVACKIKKETLIVCSGEVGVQQWKREILKWTSQIQPHQIVTLTSKTEKNYKYNVRKNQPILVISSYPFLSSKLTKKEDEGYKELEWVRRLPWGLVLFDEVQWLPASGYRLILDNIQSHVRIGLTATLYREDQKIKDLDFLIGPLLYEGNWRDFVDSGFLANPYCIQIRCELTPYFKSEYNSNERNKHASHREMIYCSNPNKIKALTYLLEIHKSRNDQVIIFCDSISLIKYVSQMFKIPAIYGQIPTEDRNFVYQMFRRGIFKIVLLSRTSDQAIDLPNANVAIQLTINKGSRKQVLQRLGRIMRQKDNPTMQYNALFYTMVSDETNERIHFAKRQKTLVDLGFQYDIIKEKEMEYYQPNNQYIKAVKEKEIMKQDEYLSIMVKEEERNGGKKKEKE